ncbi:MAG: hypothetical protein P9L94_15875 [Candidatus Hinthialibacter antarcticus]|nr:hypothetical protein [Candidatus Hinthialibacter antarcticus]
MKSRIFLLCSSVAIISLCLFLAHTAPGAAQEDVSYSVETRLQCANQPFQSDAVLVTTHNLPLEFHCQTNLTPAPPKDYIPEPGEWRWSASSGTLEANGDVCVWKNPAPGKQTIRVEGDIKYAPPKQGLFAFSKPKELKISFVAEKVCIVPYYVPEIKNGRVNGFVVGEYPDPLKPEHLKLIGDAIVQQRIKDNAETYSQPKLFYEIDRETYFIKVFKNYTLGDFDLDPRFLSMDYPRYIAIHPYILRKIDLFEQQLAADGHPVKKLKIFYGYRSPDYNIGRRNRDGELTLKSPFSMHMYGLAIDFIIDEDDNLVLDDLNGDGRVTMDDAREMMKSADALDKALRDQGSELVGGAGPYPHHDYYERGEVVQTPYVHIDARGYLREDDTLVRWEGKDAIGIRQAQTPYKPKAPVPQWPWAVPDSAAQ